MAMKLLSTFANKDKQQEEISRKILRTQEVDELASKANARLARSESDFAEAMAKSKEKWALWVEYQQNESKALESEVKALEERKKQALIPISMYKEEVDKTMQEAQEIVKRAMEKEEQADYLTEKLENKLSEVADRENIVLDSEKRLEVAKQGLQSQQESTKEGVRRLSEEMVLFHMKQQQDEENLALRKKELALAEISFNAKLDKYQRDLEALKVWEIQLKDERGTLERAMKRLEK
jgi:hypothetical protein